MEQFHDTVRLWPCDQRSVVRNVLDLLIRLIGMVVAAHAELLSVAHWKRGGWRDHSRPRAVVAGVAGTPCLRAR